MLQWEGVGAGPRGARPGTAIGRQAGLMVQR